MGMPEKNQQSYFKSDVMHIANNFKGKKYLLIHGTADGKLGFFILIKLVGIFKLD